MCVIRYTCHVNAMHEAMESGEAKEKNRQCISYWVFEEGKTHNTVMLKEGYFKGLILLSLSVLFLIPSFMSLYVSCLFFVCSFLHICLLFVSIFQFLNIHVLNFVHRHTIDVEYRFYSLKDEEDTNSFKKKKFSSRAETNSTHWIRHN